MSQNNHQPRRRFGQNFLIDDDIINRIITVINPKKTDNMLEIGAGKGALSLPLLDKLNQLQVVEIDRDLVAILQKLGRQNLIIHQADALKFDLKQMPKPLRIVGNLPYNISSPLLFYLLKQRDIIDDLTFMLQFEVAERINSAPNNKSYGRLSVMIQAFFTTEIIFKVPSYCFDPAPKVDSAIIYLKPRPQPKIQNFETLEMIVKAAFSHRRKTLKNCLKSHLTQSQTKIDLSKRAEMLSVENFIQLTKDYQQK